MRTFIAIGLVLVAVSSHARTWIVDQGGGGDFTLVREAVLEASPGDSILVHPGTYDEYDGSMQWTLIAQGPLTVVGTGTVPASTALRFSMQVIRGGCSIRNLKFFGECSPLVVNNGDTIVRDCLFEDNESAIAGGGAIRVSGGTLIVEDCTFYNNKSTDPSYEDNVGGAILAGASEIRRCLFIGNESGRLGGAMVAGSLLIEDCILIGNKSDDGAAIAAYGLRSMTRCTLLRNEVRGGVGSALADDMSDWSGAVSHCIIARTINGWGVECDFNAKVLECCDVWGNERGDYLGNWCDNLESNGNFSENPLLCDEETGDVGLLEGSPCLPGQHGGLECGVVGARGLGCVDVPVEALTWGKMRWLFR